MATFESHVGRPTLLTDELSQHIVSFVSRGISQRQVARLARVNHINLHHWLERGLNDQKEGIDSVFSRFFSNYEEKLGIAVEEHLDMMRATGTYQAVEFILSRLLPVEFGKDPEILRQLIENVQELQKLNKKGDLSHGEVNNSGQEEAS